MSEGRSKRACTARAKQPRCVRARWRRRRGGRAAPRRAALRRRLPRSSAHYVGYVEDDETPEAIMKKFEALERVQQATTLQQAAGGDGGAAGADGVADGKLTEEQLQEVFKQTSVFTVKSATAGPEFLYGHGASRLRPGAALAPTALAQPQLFAAPS